MFNSSSVYSPILCQALILGFFLAGCGSASELISNFPKDESVNVDYSVIYYIHADADYLYHDTAGNPVNRNSRVLDTALNVAKEGKSGEFFIFISVRRKKSWACFRVETANCITSQTGS